MMFRKRPTLLQAAIVLIAGGPLMTVVGKLLVILVPAVPGHGEMVSPLFLLCAPILLPGMALIFGGVVTCLAGLGLLGFVIIRAVCRAFAEDWVAMAKVRASVDNPEPGVSTQMTRPTRISLYETPDGWSKVLRDLPDGRGCNSRGSRGQFFEGHHRRSVVGYISQSAREHVIADGEQ
jgi:hypothetical protein